MWLCNQWTTAGTSACVKYVDVDGDSSTIFVGFGFTSLPHYVRVCLTNSTYLRNGRSPANFAAHPMENVLPIRFNWSMWQAEAICSYSRDPWYECSTNALTREINTIVSIPRSETSTTRVSGGRWAQRGFS